MTPPERATAAEIARCESEISAIRSESSGGLGPTLGEVDWHAERMALLAQTHEVFLTWPQLRALRVAQTEYGVVREIEGSKARRSNSKGCFFALDTWQGEELYALARSLPWKSTREFLLREAIVGRLEWARPSGVPKSLWMTYAEGAS